VLVEHQKQQQFSSPSVGAPESNTQEIQRLVSKLEEQRAIVHSLTYQVEEERAKVRPCRAMT
jgi:hypothetical protein